MKILHGDKILDIPAWITASDNVCNINMNTAKVNGRYGEVPAGEDIYGVRTFNCSGIIPTEKHSEVEKERSRIAALLSGKELKVYRSEDDEIFYKCRLIGAVKTGYFKGAVIGRCFSLSFSLKALDPFGYGEEKTAEINGNKNIIITNEGNYPSLPEIQISGCQSAEGIIAECGGTFFELRKKIQIPETGQLIFKNGKCFLNEKDISPYLSSRSIITPLCFTAGENTVKIKSGGKTKITFNGRYM